MCIRDSPHAAGHAYAARADGLDRAAGRGEPYDLHGVAIAVIRAHRDRAPARLAGKPRAGEGALSRGRLRRQALHQAGSAGRGHVTARAATGQMVADDGRAVLHDHQASDDVQDQERGRQRRQDHGAALRRLLERRRLCGYRTARDAEIGLHRAGPLRHRERGDRFLCALHQPAPGRRAARFRHSAAGVGL